MGAKAEKTNVMRLLDQKKLSYREYSYDGADGTLSGAQIAQMLGQNSEKVFKTLVTVGKSGKNYVFMVPVEEELDLKKAAKAAGEKSIAMIRSKELLPLTGYIHGGCSPIGMKKPFLTFAHKTMEQLDTVFFSGGRIGFQVEMTPTDLQKAVRIGYADIIVSDAVGEL